MIRRLLVLAVSVIGLTACETELICTLIARPGIVVTMQDSVTSGRIGGRVIATARDGIYADTALGPGPVGLAYDRAGRYDVAVEATGYLPWAQEGVRVTRDECHVRTVSLLALLQPDGGDL